MGKLENREIYNGSPVCCEHYEKKSSPYSLIPKRTYTSPPVKVENWQHYMCKDVGSLFAAPECCCRSYKTTYGEMNDCLKLKDNYVNPKPSQYFFNYFGYNANKTSDEVWDKRAHFPIIFNNDHNICPTFQTTMQTSYGMPYPIILEDARQFEYHTQYRRVKSGNAVNSKFTDDGERERTRTLSDDRGPLFRSYNFMTGLMTDGQPPKAMSFLQAGLLRHQRAQ